VHGRTKVDGYKPPARWAQIDRVRAAVGIPIIANGEVWTVADFRQCQQESGCADIMLGRGALADPLLPRKVRGEAAGGWPELVPAVATYWYGVRERVMPVHAGGRLKQWLMLLRRHYPQAEALYQQLRPVKAAEDIDRLLLAAGILNAARPPAAGADGRQFPFHQQRPERPARGSGGAGRAAIWPTLPQADTRLQPPGLLGGAGCARRLEPQAPLILDAGCGVGWSTLRLAERYPDHFVIGVDQSSDRISRGKPLHCRPTPFSCAPIWSISGVCSRGRCSPGPPLRALSQPWPKIGHLARRWHGHAVFPDLLALGGVFECRSNWRIYIEVGHRHRAGHRQSRVLPALAAGGRAADAVREEIPGVRPCAFSPGGRPRLTPPAAFLIPEQPGMSEPVSPCQSCGACCASFRVDFHPAELAGGAFAWGGVPWI
jgi:hypothetical protein